jgi:hypothetical protein
MVQRGGHAGRSFVLLCQSSRSDWRVRYARRMRDVRAVSAEHGVGDLTGETGLEPLDSLLLEEL